jgi:hypothetical protein
MGYSFTIHLQRQYNRLSFMGSQMGYRGRIGNVIHYKMGNKFYSRSAPVKYEQTDASKASAKVFGKASSIGALIRKGLSSVIPNSFDRKMHGRLVAEIFTWLQIVRDRPAAKNNQPRFDFLYSLNSEAPRLSSRLNVDVQVINPSRGMLEIWIPPFVPKQAIIAPPATVEVICRIATAVIDLNNIKSIGRHRAEIIYPLDDNEAPGQTIPVELPMPEGSLVVTGLSLVYAVDKDETRNIVSDNAFLPSKIIKMFYL